MSAAGVDIAAGASRRRRERRLRSWLKHERMTPAMALAKASHHTAPRGQRTARAGEWGREMSCTATIRDSPTPQPELFSLHEEEPGGSRPDRMLTLSRPQKRVLRRTVQQIVDTVPSLPTLDDPVQQMENRLVEMCRKLDILILEQAIEVPKISSSSHLSCRRRVLRLPQTAEQLMEVPTIVSVSSLRALVEQNEDIPVPRGRGGLVGRRGLQGFSQGQNSAAFLQAEHVDIPVPRRGGLQSSCHGQGSAASSSHSLDAADEASTVFFSNFSSK